MYPRTLQTRGHPFSARTKTRILIILFVCLAARLVLFGVFQPWNPDVESERVLWRDAVGYHRLAITLIEAHRFAYEKTGQPDALRTPLYPGLVAITYSAFGYRPWVVMVVQILLDILACLLMFLSLSRMFDEKVGLLAAGFYSLEPFLILYSAANLVSDSLFILLVILTLYLVAPYKGEIASRRGLLRFGLSGLSIGLATLTRPVSIYLPVCVAIFLLLACRRNARIALRYSAVTIVVFLITISPWLYRNLKTFGYLSLSTSGQYNLLVLDVTPMEMSRRHLDRETVKQELLAEADEMMDNAGKNPSELNRFQVAEYWNRLARRYIADNPTAFAHGYLLGVSNLFLNLGTTDYGRTLGLKPMQVDFLQDMNVLGRLRAFMKEAGMARLLIAAPIAIFLLLSYLGAALGVIVSWRIYDWRNILLVLLFGLYFVLVTGPAGLARFKLPSIPFYLAFSAIGYSFVYTKLLVRKHAQGDGRPECAVSASEQLHGNSVED